MKKAFVCKHKKCIVGRFITTPFDTHIKNFDQVTRYFMYYAPNIDCRHSTGRLEGEEADRTFQELIITANMQNMYKCLEKIQAASWNEYALNGDELCMECSRMTFEKCKNNEHDLTALLRHIRNSFAHGLIYIRRPSHSREVNMLLEDYNRNGRMTARIVITFQQLEAWKAKLEDKIAIGE